MWISVDPLMEKYPNISPYAYAALNPVKYVDPDGRDIIIGTITDPKWNFISGQYKYSKGKIYFRSGDGLGNWSSWNEYSDDVTNDMKTIVDDLNKLSANSEGVKLVNFFEKEGNDVSISIVDGNNQANGKFIKYSGKPLDLPEEGSGLEYVSTDSYIVLGHEMGHVESNIKGLNNTSNRWVAGISHDEIYATHIENKIRSAAGLKLRDRYNLGLDYRVIDKDRNSLFIDKKETYPSYPATILRKEDSFNYNSIKKDEQNK